jgi:GNAT superfamily N-acetyltransferase
VQFAVDVDAFRALPRHPDWAYEYLDGRARLYYRPRPLELVRDLSPVPARRPEGDAGPDGPQGLVVEPASTGDRDDLVVLVESVWDDLDPYRTQRATPDAGPDDRAAARFARTLEGADDPWDPGVLVARTDAGAGPVAGVVAVNAWRPVDDPELPAEPCITWLTVEPRWRMAGVATALLAATVEVAIQTGAGELHSAVSGANIPSVSWHWVNGFHPLARP